VSYHAEESEHHENHSMRRCVGGVDPRGQHGPDDSPTGQTGRALMKPARAARLQSVLTERPPALQLERRNYFDRSASQWGLVPTIAEARVMVVGGMKVIPPATTVALRSEERQVLEAPAGSRKAEARMRDRARTVLLASTSMASRAMLAARRAQPRNGGSATLTTKRPV
jgi:hypothetical protein